MKIRQKYEHTMATREFTDREEPRKAFWKKYNSFKAEMDEANFLDKEVLARWYNDQPGGSLHCVYVVEIEAVYTA